MRKPKLTVNQSIDLILAHMRASRGQWKISASGAIRRVNVKLGQVLDVFSGRREIKEEDCCPITSLASRDVDDWEAVAHEFGIPSEAKYVIVEAADDEFGTEGMRKESKALRRRMLTAAGLK